MKFIAPYRNFRYKTLCFNLGFIETSDEKTIKLIKKIPVSLGEIKDPSGNIVNQPSKPKKTKNLKEARDVLKAKPK